MRASALFLHRFVRGSSGPLVVALAVGFAVSGCGARGQDESSRLAHAADEIVAPNRPYLWGRTSDEDYKGVIIGEGHVLSRVWGFDRNNIVARTHATVDVAQYWLDTLDDAVRAKYGDRAKTVPRPEAQVIATRTQNSFATPVTICLRLAAEVERDPALGAAATPVGIIALTQKTHRIYVERRGHLDGEPTSEDCARSTMSDADEAAAVAAYAQALRPDCTARVEDGRAIFAKECLKGGNYDDFTRASLNGVVAGRVALELQSHWITFFSELFATLTEEEFASVVAHELGHYYRAHGLVDEATFNTFYTIGDVNPTTRPGPTPASQALGKRLLDAYGDQVVGHDHPVAGQEFDSALFGIAPDLSYYAKQAACPAKDASVAAPCDHPCATLYNLLPSYPNDGGPFGGFPGAALPTSGQDAYNNYENLVRQCFGALHIEPSVGPMVVSANSVALTVSFLSHGFAAGVRPATPGESLLDYFRYLSGRVPEYATLRAIELHDLQIAAVDQHLGYYTTEQEADEVGTELLADAGVDPRVGVDLQLKLLAATEPHGFDEYTYDECVTLYRNGWRDSEGHPVFVAPAMWGDPHHSSCFRAFDVSRELAAHRYPIAPVRPERVGPAWDDIAAAAVALRPKPTVPLK